MRVDVGDHRLDGALHLCDRLRRLRTEHRLEDDRGGDQHHLFRQVDLPPFVGQVLPAHGEAQRFADHQVREGRYAPRSEEGRHQLPLAAPQIAGATDQTLADHILPDDVVAALLVVALAARDRDLLDSVGMHEEHEPTQTDLRFEDIAVLTPKIAGEVKEPPASNAAREGDRTYSGRVHHQAPSRDARHSIRAGNDLATTAAPR